MAACNVLVVFYSRYGATERLALAAGVGALQARAAIRLRRIADLADPKTIEADSNWSAQLARMNRDYVAPRPDDAAWADVILLAAPTGGSPETDACERLLRATPGRTVTRLDATDIGEARAVGHQVVGEWLDARTTKQST